METHHKVFVYFTFKQKYDKEFDWFLYQKTSSSRKHKFIFTYFYSSKIKIFFEYFYSVQDVISWSFPSSLDVCCYIHLLKKYVGG